MTKTRTKKVATMEIGEFTAHETLMRCSHCKEIYDSDELPQLVPYRCQFGFNVIVEVGKALFVRCRNEREVQRELQERNIRISIREVNYLGKKFILYLALAHRESEGRIKKLLAGKGGYILHLDSTVEGDSPHLMSALDEITNIVLNNIKLPSEKAEHIIPFLEEIDQAYGKPIAVTRDMGKGIASAVEEVWPGIRQFICHYHFLRDIGKDLLGGDYQALRNGFKNHAIRPSLSQLARQLKAKIDTSPALGASLCSYLEKNQDGIPSEKLLPPVMAYTLVLWILDAKHDAKGHGFPFDRPYFSYYQRMVVVKDILKKLRSLVQKERSLAQLNKIIGRILNDYTLPRVAARIEERIGVFDQLRDAMRIALPENGKSLNDDGNDDNIKSIEARVKQFRRNKEIVKQARSQLAYRKMFKQLDTYWTQLFADPVTVNTSQGVIRIQPQRTNNILERFFRDLKRKFRRKTGTSSLSKALKAMLAETPFVRNLDNPDYMKLLLNGKHALEQRFAEIDAALVRELIAQQQSHGIPTSAKLQKTLRIPDLPRKLIQKHKYRVAA